MINSQANKAIVMITLLPILLSKWLDTKKQTLRVGYELLFENKHCGFAGASFIIKLVAVWLI
jgi:hypothetical protein